MNRGCTVYTVAFNFLVNLLWKQKREMRFYEKQKSPKVVGSILVGGSHRIIDDRMEKYGAYIVFISK